MHIKETKIYSAVRRIYYALKNWDTTWENFRIYCRLRPYRNRYSGKACFVVGNGPSLRIEDLDKIAQLGIPSFACNRSYLAFSKTKWRPAFYFVSDEKLIDDFDSTVKEIPVKNRFYPKRFCSIINNGMFYNTLPFAYEDEGRFSLDAAHGVYQAATITSEMMQFAYYMGFSEIYLIGVDFNYKVTNKVSDTAYAYQGEQNYFIEGYLKPGEIADMPNIKANLLGFNAARVAIEENGRVVMNATRGGKLEVFKRIDLDKLFEQMEKK